MAQRTLKKPDEWTPRALPGGVYCSPACGYGCKREDYEFALTQAGRLVKSLGKGWEPEVWENMGWHWKADKGLFRVIPIKPELGGGYTAYFQGAIQQTADGKTPGDAYAAVKLKVIRLIQRLQQEVETGA